MENIINDFIQKLLENGIVWSDCTQPFPLTENKDPIINIQNMIKLFKQCNYKLSQNTIQRKCSAKSKKYLDEGSAIFQCNTSKIQLLEASEKYTKSIAFAPIHSINLTAAYVKKCDILFHLEKYEDCLRTTDYCLNLYCTDTLKEHLMLQKAKCLSILNNAENNTISDNADEEFIDGMWKDFNYTAVNSEITASSNFISLEYNQKYGRHLIAAKDIRPGQIIAKDIPYCSVLRSVKKYSHCWGCLKFLWNCVPCDYCVNVVYCSEKCKNKSWQKFHDVECEVLPYLDEIYIESGRYDNTTLRLIILAFKELGNVNNVIEEMKEVNQCTDHRIKGFSNDHKFCSDKYRSIYSLSSHKTTSTWQIDLMFTVVVLLHLVTKTTIFGTKFVEWNEICQNEKIALIGSLILKTLQIQFINSFYVKEYSEVNEDTGTVILPFFSLINHSCYPNTFIFFDKNYEILVTFCPIKKGDQIFICYLYNCMSIPTTLRQRKLFEGYSFICECSACKENWPTKMKYPSLKEIVANENIRSILLYEIQEVTLYTQTLTNQFSTYNDLTIILKGLRKIMEIYFTYISLPCKEIELIKSLIGKCFKMSNNIKKCK